MKKIIQKGRSRQRYDTDTAKIIAVYESGPPGSDDWWKETIYRKKTGEYFLYGEGGILTKYGHPPGNTEKEEHGKIIPLSAEKVFEWCSLHPSARGSQEILDISSDTEKKTVTFRLSGAARNIVADMAAEKGITKSEVIETMIFEKACKNRPNNTI